MAALFFGVVDFLAGPVRQETDKLYTPLLRSDSTNDMTYLTNRTRLVKQRANQLMACNLQVYENYFKLATAMVTSRKSWNDPRLMEETLDHRAMSAAEFKSFENEKGSIWWKLSKTPWQMKFLILVCGLGAMVQGWDEAAVNGAQVYYSKPFGLSLNDSRIGYINGAPYACCFISCWLSWPMNKAWGRRVTIFAAGICSVVFALGQAFANNWQTMLILRIFLGLGIGPKSATIPIYASEVAPAELRGALVMMWQLFTALGIMFGYLSGVVFANVQDGNHALSQQAPCDGNLLSLNCSLNWRLMIGSPMLAPIFLCILIFMQPESPRWLIAKAQRKERLNERIRQRNALIPEELHEPYQYIDLLPVFESLMRLRGQNKLKAARDMLNIDVLLYEQKQKYTNAAKRPQTNGLVVERATSTPITAATAVGIAEKTRWERVLGSTRRARRDVWLLFSKTRNQNALIASLIVMIMQQYCGINVLIYYSTLVLFQTSVGAVPDLYPGNIPKFIVQSFVVGLINFLFGIPAVFLIDQRGRRTLLLRTFPLLAISAALVAGGNTPALVGSNAREHLILAGMYLFVIFYSPGEGPVPFVYASESFPQDIRDLGMAVVTSLNWAFNFAVAVSFPRMSDPLTMGLAGTFGFYSGMCVIGFVLIYFFVPETCQKELELLDEVFDESLFSSFAWQKLQAIFHRRRVAKRVDSQDDPLTRSRGREPDHTSESNTTATTTGIATSRQNTRNSTHLPAEVLMEPYPARDSRPMIKLKPPTVPRRRGTSPIGKE